MLRVETSQFMGGGRSGEIGGDRYEATDVLVDEIGRTGWVDVLWMLWISAFSSTWV